MDWKRICSQTLVSEPCLYFFFFLPLSCSLLLFNLIFCKHLKYHWQFRVLLSKWFYKSRPLHANLIALICEIYLCFSVKNFSLWPLEKAQAAFSFSTWKIGSHGGCSCGTSDTVEPLQLFCLSKCSFLFSRISVWMVWALAVVIRGLGRKMGEGTLLNVAGSLPLPPLLLYNPLLPCLINISASAGNLPFQWAPNSCFRYLRWAVHYSCEV